MTPGVIVLVTGSIASAFALGWAMQQYPNQVSVLTLDSGDAEQVEAAKAVVKSFDPEGQIHHDIVPVSPVLATTQDGGVPLLHTISAALAANRASARKVSGVVIGTHLEALPKARHAYLRSLNTTLGLATGNSEHDVLLHSPGSDFPLAQMIAACKNHPQTWAALGHTISGLVGEETEEERAAAFEEISLDDPAN